LPPAGYFHRIEGGGKNGNPSLSVQGARQLGNRPETARPHFPTSQKARRLATTPGAVQRVWCFGAALLTAGERAGLERFRSLRSGSTSGGGFRRIASAAGQTIERQNIVTRRFGAVSHP